MSDEFLDVPFGEYLPDLGGAPNAEMPGYLTDAVGVYRTPHGWRAMPAFADVTSATAIGGATTLMQGTYAESSTTRNWFVLNHTDGKIYESQDDGVTWVDVTPAAGSAPTFPGDFFTFDLDEIFVCSARAPIKRTLTSAAGTDFSDLADSPPIAVCGARVRQHVVLGGLVGTDLYAVQTSAIADHEDWPTPGTDDALSKESIRETLPHDLGLVKAICGGEKIGIVVQESGLTRMTYEGGNTVYSFDTYEQTIGYGKRVVTKPVTDGTLWYLHNEHGFFATDGYSVNHLSEGKIQDAIYNELVSHPDQELPGSTSIAVYDQHRGLIIVGNHLSDLQLCYDVVRHGFSWMNEATVNALISGISPDSIANGGFSGRTVHNINQSSRKLQRLSQEGATVAIQTGYIEIDPGYFVDVLGVQITGAAYASGLSVSYKAATSYNSTNVSQSDFTSMTGASTGMKYLGRGHGQFFSFRITGTGIFWVALVRGLRIYYKRAEPSR